MLEQHSRIRSIPNRASNGPRDGGPTLEVHRRFQLGGLPSEKELFSKIAIPGPL